MSSWTGCCDEETNKSRDGVERCIVDSKGKGVETMSVVCQPAQTVLKMGMLQPGTSIQCGAGSLLFSLEVEEEQKAADAGAAGLEQRLANLASLCRLLGHHNDAQAMQLAFDVHRLLAVLRAESEEGIVDVKQLAARLGAIGYRVTVRNALGGGPACFRNLRHEFLTVLTGPSSDALLGLPAGAAEGGGLAPIPAAACCAGGISSSSGGAAAYYIVDPSFRQQFEVSQPSSAYAAALELVPAVFVGTNARLVPLVHCLCAEMGASFEAMSLTLPPWRRTSAMLSKWQPSRCHDEPICCAAASSGSGSGGSPTGAAPAGPCTSSSEGGSPPGDSGAASGGSPFSRIDACEIVRQCSGRSLLSGKLTSAHSCAASSSISSMRSSSMGLVRSSSGCSGQSGASGTCGPTSGQQQLVHHHQLQQQQGAAAAQIRPAALQQAAGTVSRQPPVYKGLPATYTVKMGAAASAAAAPSTQPY